MNIFKIQEFDYNKRKKNLKVEAVGKVSSTKFFPVFDVEGKEKIFKPLSKTKPLLTPLFSYSEVYWSYLINKYIDKDTPVYSLAYCHNLNSDQPKYYEKGCIVDNVIKADEKSVNLLEFFRMFPDSSVDIDNYTNYCEMQYDYTPILMSDFFRKNESLSRKLAEQILCSILRRDDNYHYENVSLIFKDDTPIKIMPIIDLEFSQMFMYPDKTDIHQGKFSSYDEGMSPIFKYDINKSYDENLETFKSRIYEGSIYDTFDRSKNYLIMKNIKTIVCLYPDLAKNFITKLVFMKKEIKNLTIDFNSEFLGEFSSDDWEPTRMLFKEGKTENDESYLLAKQRAESNKISLNKETYNDQLKKEVIWSIDKLIYMLNFFININENQYPDIKNYENSTLYKKVNRQSEEVMQIFLDIINQQPKVKQKKKDNL